MFCNEGKHFAAGGQVVGSLLSTACPRANKKRLLSLKVKFDKQGGGEGRAELLLTKNAELLRGILGAGHRPQQPEGLLAVWYFYA